MPDCVHHFIIEPANGQKESHGACQYCGVERMFLNSIILDDGAWRDLSNELLNRKRQRKGLYA